DRSSRHKGTPAETLNAVWNERLWPSLPFIAAARLRSPPPGAPAPLCRSQSAAEVFFLEHREMSGKLLLKIRVQPSSGEKPANA
ncbi:MAG: hypothetical protein WBQ34_13305, partial [Candidatus Acidiferrales bacterium]